MFLPFTWKRTRFRSVGLKHLCQDLCMLKIGWKSQKCVLETSLEGSLDHPWWNVHLRRFVMGALCGFRFPRHFVSSHNTGAWRGPESSSLHLARHLHCAGGETCPAFWPAKPDQISKKNGAGAEGRSLYFFMLFIWGRALQSCKCSCICPRSLSYLSDDLPWRDPDEHAIYHVYSRFSAGQLKNLSAVS